jgi:hypothetical protein
MSEKLYAIGDKFGRWTIVGDPIYKQSQYYYPVKCECGRTTLKAQTILKNEYTKSCNPCYLKESKKNRKSSYIHRI